jgi:hypothetical protein
METKTLSGNKASNVPTTTQKNSIYMAGFVNSRKISDFKQGKGFSPILIFFKKFYFITIKITI